MPTAGHCRHCYGCDGTCLLPGYPDVCIHMLGPKLTLRQRIQGLGTRRFWHRVFKGT
jgi:hypothetical protein